MREHDVRTVPPRAERYRHHARKFRCDGTESRRRTNNES